uniref:Uncharacterized protein n=1 Tax=Rhizophora mucronata TaxID=61149 RepID=A0A2P2IQ99_RHIMU
MVTCICVGYNANAKWKKKKLHLYECDVVNVTHIKTAI